MLKRNHDERPRVVPAVDLLDGRVVRLRQGRFDAVTEFPVDPERVAAEFAEQGATLLHVIDLSAARDGARPPEHAAVIRRLVERSGMAVQVGGGMRSEDDVHEVLELGVARVLIGTLAAVQPDLAGRLAVETARLAVAADVLDGTVRAAGWLQDTGAPAEAFVQRLADAGVRDFLVTAIDRDGTESGPDTELLRSLRPYVPGLLMAAGGIGSPADVAAVVAAGADCAVVGRALYDGSWSGIPAEASASLRSSPTESPS
ncbi:MAG TPA: 1-(5-phosphoribosyl)-5-[(5-phosphoribosylamino)methylideneamino] imidazole-4-carboxamide isomerase [Gaiellales bacterium]|jgi:phosphoribosylformimino-5-aminoimidazole carboxamide ribotide isomerase|nr:1-(5-phosphoribosyl)-5-[(5-phosphoribosylamino)methylideneamino] imidazole-4-carboxamide isomerase [Gaiellales bacterium]